MGLQIILGKVRSLTSPRRGRPQVPIIAPEQITVSFVDYGHPNLYGTRKTLHHPDMRDLRKS